MELITLQDGFSFYKSTPSTPGIYPLVVYLCGSKEDVTKSEFVTKFVPKNKDVAVCVALCMPSGRTGWQFPYQGTAAGAWFLRYIYNNFVHDGRFYGAGWSAGGDYVVWALIADILTAFCICAGIGDYNSTIAFGKKNIPARHYHGDKDESTAANYPTYTKGKKSALEWYKMPVLNEADPKSTGFCSIPDGNHSSAPIKAFSVSTNLMGWFLQYGKPIEINPPQPELPQEEPVTEIVIKGNQVVFKSASKTITLP